MKTRPKRSNSVTHDPGAAPIVAKAWRDLNDDAKLWFYANAIEELGSPLLFTLHFTDDIKKRMERSSRTRRQYITERMAKALGRLPYFYVIEFSRNNKLHIHGALAYPLDSTPVEAFKDQLKKVCGDQRKQKTGIDLHFINRWASHHMEADRDKFFKENYGSYGWRNYCLKDTKRTRKKIEGSIIAVNYPALRKAKSIHKEISTVDD